MNSSRPYLLRALYEWIVDNDCTPHLLVDAEYPNVRIPQGFADNGQIVLNVSPRAVKNLQMDNRFISFEGRFGGAPYGLSIPVAAVMAIYARENGQGMVFDMEAEASESPDGIAAESSDDHPTDDPPRPSGRPALKIVK